jgi:hypothetical protein
MGNKTEVKSYAPGTVLAASGFRIIPTRLDIYADDQLK